MAIVLKQMFTELAKKWGGEQSVRFQESFVRAANNVIHDLKLKAHQSGISAVATPQDSLGVNADYEGVVEQGINFYLRRGGEWAVSDETDFEREYKDGLKTIQMDYFRDTDNEVYAKLGDLSS